MASPVAESFLRAAEILSSDPRRNGNTVSLEERCEVLIAGDLHGHRRNLDKLLRYADLASHPNRRLVLQEIIHAPEDAASGQDRSIEPLMRAIRALLDHPGQVLFLMGNHDLAQLTGNEISKGGRGVCKTFNAGVEHAFEEEAPEVLEALNAYLYALPLAIRCGGVFMSHSVPTPNRMELAGTEVLTRPYAEGDMHRGGPAYEWTWGRGQTPEQLDQLAGLLDVSYFILGHRHIQTGWEVISPRGVTIAADHAHGTAVQFSSGDSLAGEAIEQHVLAIAAMGA